jgi:Hypervirulence associated proteins TUDOR domain
MPQNTCSSHAVSNSAKCDDFAEPTGTAAVECSCRSNIQCENCLLCSSPAASDRTTVPKSFKIHDRVSWNSEAGCVSGTVVRVRTRNFKVKGYTHHASTDVPQYEIKSAKTDHIAFHKGSALTKLGD